MNRSSRLDVGLIAATVFCAVALVGAASAGTSSKAPAGAARAIANTQPEGLVAAPPLITAPRVAAPRQGAAIPTGTRPAAPRPTSSTTARGGHTHAPGEEHGDGHGTDGHGHGSGMTHEYKAVSCPGDVGETQLLERRDHHLNGRTECVLVDGKGTPICPADTGGDDCYTSYSPYQEDMVEGNSNQDRGASIRYHNGDKYAEGGHAHHGNPGCWDRAANSKLTKEQANTQGKAEIQKALWGILGKYAGPTGFTDALADGWYFYPVPESKQLHMVRAFWAGDMDPDHPRGTILNEHNLESFVISMTDDGWQPVNAMFMIGNEGDEPMAFGTDGYALKTKSDFKVIDDPSKLPVWESPYSSIVCEIAWHGHTDGEGAATSFDPEHPDISDWMAHVAMYAADGDPFGEQRHPDASEPHAWWEPYRHIPAACNPNGPCE